MNLRIANHHKALLRYYLPWEQKVVTNEEVSLWCFIRPTRTIDELMAKSHVLFWWAERVARQNGLRVIEALIYAREGIPWSSERILSLCGTVGITARVEPIDRSNM